MYAVHMSRRRQRRSTKNQQRPAPTAGGAFAERVVVLESTRVERLAYTRRQAAEALGISTSTFNRRVLPFVDTVETGSGMRLVPVDELRRFIAERRRRGRGPVDQARLGRPAVVPPGIVSRIRAEHAAGTSLGQIARDLNTTRTPTAQGGAQWWPSTVRAVLRRAPA